MVESAAVPQPGLTGNLARENMSCRAGLVCWLLLPMKPPLLLLRCFRLAAPHETSTAPDKTTTPHETTASHETSTAPHETFTAPPPHPVFIDRITLAPVIFQRLHACLEGKSYCQILFY